jgi:hypothetical protein
VSHAAELVAEIANELDTWPGVRIERRSDGAALVRYKDLELGVLAPDRGVVELPFAHLEHDELVQHGDAEPAVDSPPGSEMVSHNVEGPSDVTAVLELFDRRYRSARRGIPRQHRAPGLRRYAAWRRATGTVLFCGRRATRSRDAATPKGEPRPARAKDDALVMTYRRSPNF